MRRAKDGKRNISIFSNINITLNFNGKSKIGIVVICAIAIVLIAKLLVMSFSDTETIMQWLSSFLIALGC